MSVKIPIWNQRMILLMKHCKESGLVHTQKEFFESIDFAETNLKDVRKGIRSFTLVQVITAAKKYNINMNWIAGLDNEMKRRKSVKSLDLLKEAVKAVQAEYGK